MSRLGIYADKIEAIREREGLTPSGFRQDGTDPAEADPAEADKRAMEAAMYQRADAHLPPGIGGIPSADADDSEN